MQAVRKFKNIKKREAINPPVDPVEESLRAEVLWVKSAQKEISDLKTLTIFSRMREECGIAVEDWLTWRFRMQLNTQFYFLEVTLLPV